MTKDQFKQWVEETFADNLIRGISEGDLRDGLAKMADYVYDSLISEHITVNTYEEAAVLFTGDSFLTIDVISDTVYNDGDPSRYTYNPAMPDGKKISLGSDFNYTEI